MRWWGEDAEDVGGHDVGAEGDVVAAVVPLVVGAGEEVFYLEVLVVGDGELFEVEVDPAGLLLCGVEVDGDEDAVVAAGFAVAEDVRIVGGMEVERVVALEGGVVAADVVDLGDEWREAVAGGAVPVADLVFFAVEVLFAAGFDGEVFAEFEGGAVDAVVGAEGCGEDEALHEGGAASVLECGVEDVGRVGPEVGAEEVGDGRLGDLFEVLLAARRRCCAR